MTYTNITTSLIDASMKSKVWYEKWFDSPYYHILYKNRNGEEAGVFLDNLLARLKIVKGSRLLDLCCGKGRHSVYLNEKGFQVTGIDLSPQNIRYCKQFENDSLSFFVHDMRKLFCVNYFDAVINLFTSFGYFEREHDNERAIHAASKSIKPGGYLVIDFMNSFRAKNDLIPYHVKKVDGITFHIHKKIENDFIYKEIVFTDSGSEYVFREEVKILLLEDFVRYMENAGMSVLHTFGNYNLDPFDKEKSNRLIVISQK